MKTSSRVKKLTGIDCGEVAGHFATATYKPLPPSA